MKSEKLVGWYPADPAFRRKFEKAVIDGFRQCAEHGDLSLVQRQLNTILETAKIWPRRLHLSNEAFTVGTEKFTIGELIDDFIDAILLSRHTVPEKELQRLRETVETVLRRRRDAGSSATAFSNVRVVE